MKLASTHLAVAVALLGAATPGLAQPGLGDLRFFENGSFILYPRNESLPYRFHKCISSGSMMEFPLHEPERQTLLFTNAVSMRTFDDRE